MPLENRARARPACPAPRMRFRTTTGPRWAGTQEPSYSRLPQPVPVQIGNPHES